MISILIPTKNEERDLPACLDSVSWSDDVHVYDSGSSDRTLAIASERGANVTVRSYEGNQIFGGDESAHRNWALANIPFKYQWVLHVDADERVTPDLARNARRRVQDPAEHVAFRIQRRDFFLGTWLKHVQASPWYVRLFRPDRMRFERVINPIPVADGSVGDLDGYLDHYPFSKGMKHWLDRHNAYSTLEADQIIANRAFRRSFSFSKVISEKDFHQRRAHQKELFYRLPARPLLKFLALYVGKRGFLDGRAGFHYAMLQSIYEYMIVQKTRELLERELAEPAPTSTAVTGPATPVDTHR